MSVFIKFYWHTVMCICSPLSNGCFQCLYGQSEVDTIRIVWPKRLKIFIIQTFYSLLILPQKKENPSLQKMSGFSTSSQRIRHVNSKIVARQFVILSNDLSSVSRKAKERKRIQEVLLLERRFTEKQKWSKIQEQKGMLDLFRERERMERAISRKASRAFVCLKVFLLSAPAAHLNVLFLRPSEHYQTVII